MTSSKNNFWKSKLAAFLHDSPDKAADILTHELRAKQLRALFNLDGAQFKKSADFDAAAADRLPFPTPKSLTQPLNEIERLPHPLGGASIPLPPFKSAAEAEGISAKTMPFLINQDDPRALFICIWRFWRNWASSSDPRFAFLPADTRIPDHTIWNHLSVTTAFQGTLPASETYAIEDAPRLLLFSIGPVQDFIAAARATRDLWSGSYLLAYLVSKVLGEIALEFGPDHVLFPNLLDQPLIDLALRDEVFSRNQFHEQAIWDGFKYSKEMLPRLLTPSLPNRFLALLPAKDHDGKPIETWIANRVEDLKDELIDIGKSVSNHFKNSPLELDLDRFETQVERMLEIHWQTLPIPSDPKDLEESMLLLPVDTADYTPRKAYAAILEMIEKANCKPQYPLRTTSNWAGLNALISWLHDGSKASRLFDAWRPGRWESGKDFNKDTLNGKEEAVLQIEQNEAEIAKVCSSLGLSKGTFKPGELLGASTLIKRLWWHTWLVKQDVLGICSKDLREHHPMPNTRSIAAGRPYESDGEYEEASDDSEKYFAIIALDGDEMGKWISGSKAAQNRDSLSPKALKFYENHAANFLNAPRCLNPSWHLQFSEALGNFSFHAVQRIVEAFDGRLIYAGGDDVLAMLPAKDALPCAHALRKAFRGETSLNDVKGALIGIREKRKSDRKKDLFSIDDAGYLKLKPMATASRGAIDGLLSDPITYPVIVPGPATDVSVGIAIAHFKAPLQDIVRAAQLAEKRAKKAIDQGGYGRGAFAVSLFKRSGEILEWGAKWDSFGHRALSMLSGKLASNELKSRFPHKLEALLTPYLPAPKSELPNEFAQTFPHLLSRELDHCLNRNEGGRLNAENERLLIDYWTCNLDPEKNQDSQAFAHSLRQFINLLRTSAWLQR